MVNQIQDRDSRSGARFLRIRDYQPRLKKRGRYRCCPFDGRPAPQSDISS